MIEILHGLIKITHENGTVVKIPFLMISECHQWLADR
jgi:hypothetical protein